MISASSDSLKIQCPKDSELSRLYLYAGNQLGEERANMRVYESARELRIACKHDDILPSLREYAPHQETREIECGIPVKGQKSTERRFWLISKMVLTHGEFS